MDGRADRLFTAGIDSPRFWRRRCECRPCSDLVACRWTLVSAGLLLIFGGWLRARVRGAACVAKAAVAATTHEVAIARLPFHEVVARGALAEAALFSHLEQSQVFLAPQVGREPLEDFAVHALVPGHHAAHTHALLAVRALGLAIC